MKKIILLILVFIFYLEPIYSQDSIRISVSQYSYFEDDICYTAIELSILNIGVEEYVMWISKETSIVGISKENLIHDYFIKRKEDFSLLDLIYENLLGNIPIRVGDNFLKDIKCNERFLIIFLFQQKMDESYAFDFYKNKVVLIDKKKLENLFLIQNKTDIYYPFDNIILRR